MMSEVRALYKSVLGQQQSNLDNDRAKLELKREKAAEREERKKRAPDLKERMVALKEKELQWKMMREEEAAILLNITFPNSKTILASVFSLRLFAYNISHQQFFVQTISYIFTVFFHVLIIIEGVFVRVVI